MKIRILGILALTISGLMIGGCGGGGGGGGSTPPATTANGTTKVYLFGSMSSASTGRSAGVVDSLETSIGTLPAGVFVNYTSLPVSGDPPNTRRLKGGVIVPSGPVQVPAANLTALYNTVTRNMTISLWNSGGLLPLVADTTSNGNKGIEVATINFTHPVGLTPTMPATGTATVVKQFRTIGGPDLRDLDGCVVNLVTTFP